MISRICNHGVNCAVRPVLAAASVALGLATLAPIPSSAQTYSVLYSFTGRPTDGAFGGDNLVQDRSGNLYGTTSQGGPWGLGTAFKIDTTGNETVLTKFKYANGQGPMPGLIMHRGELYDTTNGGGYYGAGAVVRIDEQGKVKLLYSFCALVNCADGIFPQYGVTSDSAGNLYGTAQSGGTYGRGVVFKVDPRGNETILYNFCPNGGTCSDGGWPISGVISDAAGNLYGSAQLGPNNLASCGNTPCGVIWKLDTSGNETVLHAFTGSPSDGAEADAQLTMDASGNLYGITVFGGSSTACQYGCGTVFKIDTSSNETVLYNFTGGADGSRPATQSLVLDKKGNLYGVADNGGTSGYGTVFKLSPSGKFKVLHSFTGQTDGGYPAGLMLDKQDAVYGETTVGGDMSCGDNPGGGCGVVFKITQ